MMIDDRFAWESDFPKGFGHTSIAYLKRCPGYEDAKNGDLHAAGFVTSRCAKQERIESLKERFPGAKLVPVMSRSALPLALAQRIGLPVCHIRCVTCVKRKYLRAIERLLHKPSFCGEVTSGENYIIVEDVIVQGGTVAALRQYLLSRGGFVVAVAALAFSIGSHAVAPLGWHMMRLLYKFGARILLFVMRYGIADSVGSLTNSQVRYLLCFSSVENMEKKAGGLVMRVS